MRAPPWRELVRDQAAEWNQVLRTLWNPGDCGILMARSSPNELR